MVQHLQALLKQDRVAFVTRAMSYEAPSSKRAGRPKDRGCPVEHESDGHKGQHSEVHDCLRRWAGGCGQVRPGLVLTLGKDYTDMGCMHQAALAAVPSSVLCCSCTSKRWIDRPAEKRLKYHRSNEYPIIACMA